MSAELAATVSATSLSIQTHNIHDPLHHLDQTVLGVVVPRVIRKQNPVGRGELGIGVAVTEATWPSKAERLRTVVFLYTVSAR